MIVNVTYSASFASAPSYYQDAVATAVSILESDFSNPVTINIQIGYGEADGNLIPSSEAAINVSYGDYFSYADVRAALAAAATSPDDVSALASLPALDPTADGQFFLTLAQQKALGFTVTDPLDGYIGLSTAVNFTTDATRAEPGRVDLVGTILHEASQIMGRWGLDGSITHDGDPAYGALDLFRWSALGVRDFSGASASFSVDGSALTIPLAQMGAEDLSDWNARVSGDAFGAAWPGVEADISATDLRMMDVLGWQLAGVPVAPQASLAPLVVQDGASDIDYYRGTSDSNTVYQIGGIAKSALGDGNNLQIFGGDANAEVYVTGNDTIYAGNGTALISVGEGGHALVYGGNSTLNFIGWTGQNTVYGGYGAVAGSGMGANCTIFGGGSGGYFSAGYGGNSLLTGGGGQVTLVGGGGNDTLVASWNTGAGTNTQSNYLQAGWGNETLCAGTATGNNLYGAGFGNDFIVGGVGNDTFWASQGNAEIIGGGGDNLYVFNKAALSGTGTFGIEDFTLGKDKIGLVGFTPGNVTSTLGPNGVVLTLSDNTRITLYSIAQLPSDSIVQF